MAGDFNCELDTKQDKLPPEHGAPSRKSKALKYPLEELGLVISWRALNSHVKKNYLLITCTVHGSYSRLDMICASKQDLHRVLHSAIGPITLSDHGPVRITLNIQEENHFRYWRLNVSMLGIPEIQKHLKATIYEYFLWNDNGEVSTAVLWDGAKAVIRGKCIELASKLNKQWVQRQIELENQIKRLEQAHKIDRRDEKMKQLKSCREALDKLLTYRAERAMRFTGQKYYELGNRASHLLAFQQKKKQATRIQIHDILEIKWSYLNQSRLQQRSKNSMKKII